jgi:hypothetical protein
MNIIAHFFNVSVQNPNKSSLFKYEPSDPRFWLDLDPSLEGDFHNLPFSVESLARIAILLRASGRGEPRQRDEPDKNPKNADR